MKIGRYGFKAAQVQVGGRIRGFVTVPQGAKIVHYGIAPDLKGNLCVWTEESGIALAPGMQPIMEEHEFLILKHGDDIPAGFEFKGAIVANPVLFAYMRTVEAAGASKLN